MGSNDGFSRVPQPEHDNQRRIAWAKRFRPDAPPIGASCSAASRPASKQSLRNMKRIDARTRIAGTRWQSRACRVRKWTPCESPGPGRLQFGASQMSAIASGDAVPILWASKSRSEPSCYPVGQGKWAKTHSPFLVGWQTQAAAIDAWPTPMQSSPNDPGRVASSAARENRVRCHGRSRRGPQAHRYSGRAFSKRPFFPAFVHFHPPCRCS